VIAITIPAITNTKIRTVVQYQSLGMLRGRLAVH
jgi:hypothetical protein